ncbi:putative urease superfamily metal-dependent hydrolase [Natronocella acetinitrilica]|uniref:Urease superfamily metal-dependent hydrolase n=1 Tax=Natronocella acetinitrilica TaxID=414046 RepID=A0AAE3GAR5_9GAMM|nr:hypothetical protein [Natronocella acetinitrilica]MCP1676827.1 putative urease superfamily metal-dependent hydrolase [Natronocella acetinitrilica]
MSKTVTAAYDNIDKANNALDELISEGFIREEVFLDKSNNQVKVIVPDSVRRRAEDILRRHEPNDLWDRPFEPA